MERDWFVDTVVHRHPIDDGVKFEVDLHRIVDSS